MLTLFGITMPAPTTTITDVGEWSSAMFEEVWPALAVVGGMIIAGLIGSFIIAFFWKAIPATLQKWIYPEWKRNDWGPLNDELKELKYWETKKNIRERWKKLGK